MKIHTLQSKINLLVTSLLLSSAIIILGYIGYELNEQYQHNRDIGIHDAEQYAIASLKE